MVRSQEWQVIARDPDLNRAGYLPWETLVVDHRHADVSSWTLTLPAIPSVLDKIGPGWGAIILRNGTELLSGPLEDDGPRSWSAATDGGPGTLTVTGADDLAIVANELAYPDPTQDAASQTGGTYQDTQGPAPAETVIKHYVSANVGASRATARGDASAPDARTVTVATDLGRGDVVQYAARFDNLLAIIQAISQAGSDIGAQVTQSGSDLVFDVYEPRDLTSRMRFTREAGTLTAITSTVSMPTLTHAVVLGSGTGAAQVIAEADDSTQAESWRMIVRQTVSGTSTTSTAQLTQDGKTALAAGKSQYARAVTIVETAQVRYPDTVRRGDLVTIVDPTRGTVITDVISSAHIEADASMGTKLIQLNIGTPLQAASSNSAVNQIKTLKRRIDILQRRTP